MNFIVREYVDDAGRIPFRNWLGDLDTTTRARVQARILRFETGNLGDHKDVVAESGRPGSTSGPATVSTLGGSAARLFCFC